MCPTLISSNLSLHDDEQVDWRQYQNNHRDEWLACMRSTFEGLDIDRDGLIGSEQLVELLREKLPEEEVCVPHQSFVILC